MAKVKIKWKVSEAPTGRYRSFYDRDWPRAHYNNADALSAASIDCDDEYTPARAKSGNHQPLTIRVADHSVKPWRWRKLIKTAATLDEAKALAADFLDRHPHFAPSEEKTDG